MTRFYFHYIGDVQLNQSGVSTPQRVDLNLVTETEAAVPAAVKRQ